MFERTVNWNYSRCMTVVPSSELQTRFGAIDIYLFDQLARGAFDERRRVLRAPLLVLQPHVAVQHQEGRNAEERQRGDDAAGRTQRFGTLLAVAERDAVRRAVAERLADALAVP